MLSIKALLQILQISYTLYKAINLVLLNILYYTNQKLLPRKTSNITQKSKLKTLNQLNSTHLHIRAPHGALPGAEHSRNLRRRRSGLSLAFPAAKVLRIIIQVRPPQNLRPPSKSITGA